MTSPLANSLRLSANLLQLWALCGKPACRRARTCRRNSQTCVARYGPLAPEEARLGALALVQGLHDGASAAVVRFHAPAETAALDAWSERIAAAARGGQARGTCDDTPPIEG